MRIWAIFLSFVGAYSAFKIVFFYGTFDPDRFATLIMLGICVAAGRFDLRSAKALKFGFFPLVAVFVTYAFLTGGLAVGGFTLIWALALVAILWRLMCSLA
jgi:hypothetical protein